MGKPITAWSYSRLSVYEKCPLQFKYKFIDKLPTKPFFAAERGNILHAKAEQFVKGTIRGMPKELRSFGNELRELKRLCADTELDLSVTKDWQPSHTKDWNNVWCRAFLDASVVERKEATVIDYKTGKIYEEPHSDQGNLYATCTFAHYPEVKTVDVEFWYFDQEDVRTYQYSRKDFPKLVKTWENRVKPVFRENEFNKCPGHHCRWCDFNKHNGGPCDE